jgi:hypothetical protein
VWAATSPSSARPWIDGQRSYEPTLEVEDHRRGAQISVIARDVRTGKVLRTYPIARHDTFFDQVRLDAVDAHDGGLDLTAEFIILD